MLLWMEEGVCDPETGLRDEFELSRSQTESNEKDSRMEQNSGIKDSGMSSGIEEDSP